MNDQKLATISSASAILALPALLRNDVIGDMAREQFLGSELNKGKDRHGKVEVAGTPGES